MVELLVAIVDDGAQLLGGARSEEIDGVGHRGAGEELRLQFLGIRTLDPGYVEPALGEGIGEHDARASGMGDDGEVAALQFGEGEDAPHGGELFAGEAAHDTGLAEQGLDGGVARGDGSRMRGGGTRAALAGAGLDGGNATTLADEGTGVEEQLVGV